MPPVNKSIFPLADTSTNDLRNLVKTLWQWRLCQSCEAGAECEQSLCPWTQCAERLETFFQYYRETTVGYIPEFTSPVKALKTHHDLRAIIRDIKLSPQLQRHTISQLHFSQRAAAREETELPSQFEQDQAFNFAVRIMTMVNSSSEDHVESALLESGSMPVTWHRDTSFADFINAAFPTQDTTLQVTNNGDFINQSTKLAKLTAKRLKRVAGLQLVPTDNLQNHLRLDARRNIVEIYHHTAVLKEHLLTEMDAEPHDETARGISE